MAKLSLKPTINRLLRPLNLRISRAYKGRFTGLHLFSDLRLLIPNRSPMCLDVGANIGQTIERLQATFDAPTIHAFEPSRKTFERLSQRNFGDRVSLHRCGMGKQCEEREFINYSGSTLSSFLPMVDGEQNPFRDATERHREVVPVDTVDHFLEQRAIDEVDLLKIDTQGLDLDVLLGAEQSLGQGRIHHVLVEINFVQLYEGQPHAEAIMSLLRRHGLSLIDLYEKTRQGKRLAWCTALFGRPAT